MIYPCIGKCGASKEFEVAPYPEHPDWGWLCSTCANTPARKGSRNSTGFVAETPHGLRSVTGTAA